MLPLDGIKILDLTIMGPGAFCTMILGDFGAEVIKIEAVKPNPFIGAGPSPKENRKAAVYFTANRNKKSIAIDLRSEQGRLAFHRMAKQADVVLEGFRPGTVKRLGIDYETIKSINPRIVYCSITGYGQDGPYRDLPGHDINYVSMAGALDLIGSAGASPAIPLNLIGDFAGGALYAAIGIMAALTARNHTGRGQYIDTAMTDGVISLMSFIASQYFLHGVVPRRGESVLQGAYPHMAVYETKDKRYIAVACVEPHFWENLCRFWGKEEYIPFNAGLATARPKDQKWSEISSELRNFFLTRTMNEWFDLLTQKDIPISKVYNMAEVFSDPQVLHRQMKIDVPDQALGKIPQIGIAPKLSDTPGMVRHLAPLLGEHTDMIMRELGYSPEEIKALRDQKIVA